MPDASLIDLVIKVENHGALLDDVARIVKIVKNLEANICEDSPQKDFFYGNNRKLICGEILEKYKDLLSESAM
jgi:hypothetical protein